MSTVPTRPANDQPESAEQGAARPTKRSDVANVRSLAPHEVDELQEHLERIGWDFEVRSFPDFELLAATDMAVKGGAA